MYAVKAGSLSQTTKAVKLRNSRVSRMNERRFNTPLRAFLEHKYPTIYTEYTDLYRLMSTAHPRRKKLVSSTTFRQWKAANSPTVIPPACGDILTQALQETFATETPGQNSTQHDQQFSPPAQQDSYQNNHPHVQDTLPQITNEDIQNVLQQDSPQEDENILIQVDNIINELVMNEDVRDILEQPNPTEDEGIELNPFEELYGDIEEFDYTLEVGSFEF